MSQDQKSRSSFFRAAYLISVAILVVLYLLDHKIEIVSFVAGGFIWLYAIFMLGINFIIMLSPNVIPKMNKKMLKFASMINLKLAFEFVMVALILKVDYSWNILPLFLFLNASLSLTISVLEFVKFKKKCQRIIKN